MVKLVLFLFLLLLKGRWGWPEQINHLRTCSLLMDSFSTTILFPLSNVCKMIRSLVDVLAPCYYFRALALIDGSEAVQRWLSADDSCEGTGAAGSLFR